MKIHTIQTVAHTIAMMMDYRI